MEQSNPSSNPNPKSTIHVGGIPVEFPCTPYGTQMAFMNRVISTLDRAQREGHCHALLESPTGTGKTLSLLCSALAWQRNYKLKNITMQLNHSSMRADPEAVSDPINHGGGFIPETQPSGSSAIPLPATSNVKKAKLVPTVFYSTRTHSQLSQVIREYKKTSYRVPMAVLGSRKRYCTNPYLRGEDNVDEKCKLLLKKKNSDDSCPEFKNVHKVKSHPSLQRGGCHEVHDIEDLVKIGQVVKGCSYFAARSMAQEAELVFCPYNYVMNPTIRDAMEVDISGSVIIFDEAHNIEDIARDAGSIDLDEESLLDLQTELGHLSLNDDMTYQPLFEMTEDILSWIGRKKDSLVKLKSQHYFRCWTGEKALKELQEANISMQSFTILQECAKKAIRLASEAELDIVHLSGMAATTLEGLFSSLSYFFSGGGSHASDYELALQRVVKKEKDGGGWTNTLSLWCLNPAVVFKSIAECCQSVILTSGTLSPLNTFSSELGVQFGTCLEAPHVIDIDSQVWTAAIATGPGNYPLNASYKTADEYAFQDAVGMCLEEICKVVPGGCLVFFPSYKLLDKLSIRWQETGQWSSLNAQKTFFTEPRGSNQDSFEPVLKGYYKVINQGAQSSSGKRIRGKRIGLKTSQSLDSRRPAKTEGAAFLAVCRGKVSEGIDFSDDNARAVVIVGIPFPNIFDVKVAQKKKFNNIHESSKSLLSGDEWYCQQAFRALNQAAGRCIRHRFDYGAVIFLDERFHKDRNRAYISKWLRKSIRLYSCFEESLNDLKTFFRDVKDHIGQATNPPRNPDVKPENIQPTAVQENCTRNKNCKVTKSTHFQQKGEPNDNERTDGLAHPSFPGAKHCMLSTPTSTEVVTLTDEKDPSVCRDYIDLECASPRDSRWHATPLVASSSDDFNVTIVNETPSTNCGSPIPMKTFSSEAYNPSLTTYSAFPALPEPSPVLKGHASPTTPSRSATTTPNSGISAKFSSKEPEAESSWSVTNAVRGKRKKFSRFPSVGYLHEFNIPFQVPLDRLSSMGSSITTIDSTSIIEETYHPENECGKSKSVLSLKPCDIERDERLELSCPRCENPLGLAENDRSVPCSLVSTSKGHLLSLWKKDSEGTSSSASVLDVLVCDTWSVDQHLCRTAQDGVPGQGIWCKEDGCVYNSLFCPFCIDNNICLGVHVVATDTANMKFQNKILFCVDRLKIKRCEPKMTNIEEMKDEAFPSPGNTSMLKYPSPDDAFEKFAFVPPVQDSGGWIKKKSRMRLPKRE